MITKMHTSSKACPRVPSVYSYETPQTCVCAHPQAGCVHRPAVHAQTRISSAPQTCPSPTNRERSSLQGPSQLILTCEALSSDTHMCSDPSRHAYVLSPTVVYTQRAHTHSQVNTDPRGSSQLLIHLLIHSEIHVQLHIEGHLHIRGPSWPITHLQMQCSACLPVHHVSTQTHREPAHRVYSASHKPPCSDPEKPPHARSHMCAALPRLCSRAHIHRASEVCTVHRGLRGVHTHMGPQASLQASEANTHTCGPQRRTHA